MASDEPALCRRKTALQSAIAPSPIMIQNATAPKAMSVRGGHTNLDDFFRSTNPRVSASHASNSRGFAKATDTPPIKSATAVKCAAGGTPAAAINAPKAAPVSPPTLHNAWNEDMIGR